VTARFLIERSRVIRSGKIAGTTLDALALLAFRDVLDLAVFEECLHLDFSATRTVKALGRTRSAGVLANGCHGNSFFTLESILKTSVCQPGSNL